MSCTTRFWSLAIAVLLLGSLAHAAANNKKKKPSEPSALDRYLQEAIKQPATPTQIGRAHV